MLVKLYIALLRVGSTWWFAEPIAIAGNSQIEAKEKKYVPKNDSDGTAGTAGPTDTWFSMESCSDYIVTVRGCVDSQLSKQINQWVSTKREY